MSQELSNKFQSNNIPLCCQDCTYRHEFDHYKIEQGLQFIDWRNDNLCNLKCRSCTPQWSSKIAQEENIYPVRNYLQFNLDSLQWENVVTVYFCGGEPFLSQQHLEVLKKIKTPSMTCLHYNTNCTSLLYKNCYVPDLWTNFQSVTVNASIDAVDGPAECVRSGTVWPQVNQVLLQLEHLHQQNKINLCITPYVSALNIWWIDQWENRFTNYEESQIRPIVSSHSDVQGLGIIPFEMRPRLIKKLLNSKFRRCFAEAVEILNNCDLTEHWNEFLFRQKQIDNKRKENWFNLFQQLHQINHLNNYNG